MKMYEIGSVVLIVFIGICAFGSIVSQYWGGPDNQIEEFLEDQILDETGLEIDFSPTTPEGK